MNENISYSADARPETNYFVTLLARGDEFLTDQYSNFYSLEPHEGFLCYSDRFEKVFSPDYTLSEDLALIPKSHRLINFNWLKDLLLSKDLTRLHELTKLGEDPMFLDQSVSLKGQNICFASFPRTGNTFLRTFIEQCTGVYTGSDMSLLITLPF